MRALGLLAVLAAGGSATAQGVVISTFQNGLTSGSAFSSAATDGAFTNYSTAGPTSFTVSTPGDGTAGSDGSLVWTAAAPLDWSALASDGFRLTANMGAANAADLVVVMRTAGNPGLRYEYDLPQSAFTVGTFTSVTTSALGAPDRVFNAAGVSLPPNLALPDLSGVTEVSLRGLDLDPNQATQFEFNNFGVPVPEPAGLLAVAVVAVAARRRIR